MTRKFVVLKDFTDLKDDGHVYRAGDFYPREGAELDENRAVDLEFGHNARNEKLIIEVMVKEEPKRGETENKEASERNEYPKHIGGGFYELSNGEKVKGKDAAQQAEADLKGGE